MISAIQYRWETPPSPCLKCSRRGRDKNHPSCRDHCTRIKQYNYMIELQQHPDEPLSKIHIELIEPRFRCNTCGKAKLRSEFFRDRSNPRGRRYRCKECDRKARADTAARGELKRCSKCGKTGHARDFKKHTNICKACAAQAQRKWYERNRTAWNRYVNQRRGTCERRKKDEAVSEPETVLPENGRPGEVHPVSCDRGKPSPQ